MPATDFTIRDVLEWARTKPADEEYDFVKAGVCALGQFAREMRGWSEADAVCGRYERYLPDGLRDAANPLSGSYLLHGETFGQFVKRLEALCPDTPVTSNNWLSIDAYMRDIEQVSA